VPVHLNLHMSDSNSIQGEIEVKSFPVEVFRRHADVEKLNFFLQSPISESHVNGILKVKYTDYTMKIHMVSTIDAPKIYLSSEPPLPENQLLATLLFWETPREFG
jgi:hypothetical protein